MRNIWIVLLILGSIGCQEKNAFAAQFLCGETVVHFKTLNSNKADMTINGKTYVLKQVISASGVKYEHLNNSDTIFWNKGNKAQITLEGTPLPECVELNSTQQQSDTTLKNQKNNNTEKVKNITWQLEELNQSGIIDNSHITLLFGDENQMSGNSGCNRYMGQYNLEGESLNINPHIASTMMACSVDLLMQQEKLFLEVLANMKNFNVDETGALILQGDDGQTLKFRHTMP